MKQKDFETMLKQLDLSVLSKREIEDILARINIPPQGICHDFATIATEYDKI